MRASIFKTIVLGAPCVAVAPRYIYTHTYTHTSYRISQGYCQDQFQAAVDLANATGGSNIIQFPAGTFKFQVLNAATTKRAEAVIIYSSRTVIRGAGSDCSTGPVCV